MQRLDIHRGITGYLEDRAPDGDRRSPFEGPGHDRRFEVEPDVHEDEAGLRLECALPDMSPEAIDVRIDGETVLILDARAPTESGRPMARTFRLPPGCDPRTARADVRDGVLRLHLARRL